MGEEWILVETLKVGQVHGNLNGNSRVLRMMCTFTQSSSALGLFNWFSFSWLNQDWANRIIFDWDFDETSENVMKISNWRLMKLLFEIFSDGALKYRNSISQYHPGNGYTNPCLHASVDQISTISRPRSSTDAMNQVGGSPIHGRQLNGILSRGANGLHEDLDFPPTPRTLTRKKNVVWMRPHVSSVSYMDLIYIVRQWTMLNADSFRWWMFAGWIRSDA